jgi:GNAT superfamily N-acetyltransferase
MAWILHRASCADCDLVVPAGFDLVRISATSNVNQVHMIEAAMRAAGEPEGLVAPRFAHGDECFGWAVGGEMVSFGWVTSRDRVVGNVRLAECAGRFFLYNFFTKGEFRGRGLYPALLRSIRFALGREGASDCIIEVNDQNTSSARGIDKAGFLPVARVNCLRLFNRWIICLDRRMLDATIAPLF